MGADTVSGQSPVGVLVAQDAVSCSHSGVNGHVGWR